MAEVMTVTAKFVLQTQQFRAGLNQATASAKNAARQITTRFQNAARQVQMSFSSMTSAIVNNQKKVLAAVVSIVYAFRKLSEDIDRIAKFSRRLGVPVAVLQQLESVAGKSGITVSELTTALQDFQKKTAEAAQGSGPLADALKRLGIDAKQFAELSLNERIDLIADQMSGMTSEVAKTKLAVDAFGESGQKMVTMLGSGSQSVRQLREDFEDIGFQITDQGAESVEAMNDAFQRLMETVKSTGQAITVELAGPLKQVFDFVTAFTTELRTSKIPVFFTGALPAIKRFRERRQLERERAAGSTAAALNPTIPAPTNPIEATQSTVGQISTFFGTFKTGERDQLRLLDQIRKATQDTVSAIRNQRGELT